MAGGAIHDGPPTQSGFVTGVFAFNLIIGVGALSLPYALNQVGWILGGGLILTVGLLGYVSATFVIESIANTSALKSLQEAAGGASSELPVSALVTTVAVSYTEPEQQDRSFDARLFRFRHLELAALSDTLFPRWGKVMFYFIICVYLYGDLAIYGAAVPSILHKVTGVNYNILLAIFSACMCPWVFFNFQKTKLLQFATLATRNSALLIMIILTLRYIGQGKGTTHVPTVRPQGVSTAFGSIVYAFMCHHSIPSIVAPMQFKSNVNKVFLFTFVFVGVVYLSLSISALYAFADTTNKTCSNKPSQPCSVQKLYTDNFSSFNQHVIAEYLTLFPIFTLTSNFPLISITLRNNLKALFTRLKILNDRPQYQHYACCVLSPFPPLLLSFAVHDVSVLVGITGAYAGMFIMFIVPTCLVYLSRKAVADALGRPVPEHETRSPFRHTAWIVFILAFSGVSLVLITINQILTHK